MVTKVENKKGFIRYAIVQYKVGNKFQDFNLPPHGNDRRRERESYVRTKATVMERIKRTGEKEAPKRIIRDLQGPTGVTELESHSDIPRDRQQVYNALKKVPGRIRS